MEGGRVEVVAEIAWGELALWPACHRMKAGHYLLVLASPQLRALADSLVLRRVRKDHVAISQMRA